MSYNSFSYSHKKEYQMLWRELKQAEEDYDYWHQNAQVLQKMYANDRRSYADSLASSKSREALVYCWRVYVDLQLLRYAIARLRYCKTM